MWTGKRPGTVLAALAAVVAFAAPGLAASVTSESPLGTSGAGKAEVSLGDLVADAIRAAIDADIAFVSASELKETDSQIPRGKVTTEDVSRFITYTDDPIVEVRLTGKQVRQALERSVLIHPQKNLGFLQVSGIRFRFDPNKPKESRVTSVTVDREPLSEGETYSVAMTSSMAGGALGYYRIWSKEDRGRVTEITIPKAIDQFFSTRDRINYSNLNRITAGS